MCLLVVNSTRQVLVKKGHAQVMNKSWKKHEVVMNKPSYLMIMISLPTANNAQKIPVAL